MSPLTQAYLIVASRLQHFNSIEFILYSLIFQNSFSFTSAFDRFVICNSSKFNENEELHFNNIVCSLGSFGFFELSRHASVSKNWKIWEISISAQLKMNFYFFRSPCFSLLTCVIYLGKFWMPLVECRGVNS